MEDCRRFFDFSTGGVPHSNNVPVSVAPGNFGCALPAPGSASIFSDTSICDQNSGLPGLGVGSNFGTVNAGVLQAHQDLGTSQKITAEVFNWDAIMQEFLKPEEVADGQLSETDLGNTEVQPREAQHIMPCWQNEQQHPAISSVDSLISVPTSLDQVPSNPLFGAPHMDGGVSGWLQSSSAVMGSPRHKPNSHVPVGSTYANNLGLSFYAQHFRSRAPICEDVPAEGASRNKNTEKLPVALGQQRGGDRCESLVFAPATQKHPRPYAEGQEKRKKQQQLEVNAVKNKRARVFSATTKSHLILKGSAENEIKRMRQRQAVRGRSAVIT